ncbi:MAG: hypothetical protein ICV83_21735 [Cytophagales bacterium]|nr:hypothetical protein [Cytophagales bacterium]
MLAKRPYMRVRLALVAERYRAIVEETRNCYLAMREVAALSVSGRTPEETRNKFRAVLDALRQKRKLPRRMAVRLVAAVNQAGGT